MPHTCHLNQANHYLTPLLRVLSVTPALPQTLILIALTSPRSMYLPCRIHSSCRFWSPLEMS